MSTPYELASLALDELIAWSESNSNGIERNEATTRLHLVNRLLEDVLGWPAEEIEAEPYLDGDFLDYRLGRPFARMVVEAKREGKHFDVPAGSTALVQSLRSLTSGAAGANLREAADQVAGYCGKNGVPVAVVCNGTQIVAFLGTRQDGIPPLGGSALVFPSLDYMRANFRAFWDNLSKYGVENRTIHLTLREGENPSAPDPLSAQLYGYPGFKRRNDIQTGLEILAELFLEDITRAPELQQEFLASTYATSGALTQYALISRQILDSRYSVLHESDVNIEVESVVDKKGATVNSKLSGDILASGLSKRPLILLGDVGVGKTMFIRHLVEVDAKDFFAEAISIYVDFGRQPTLLTELDDFVVAEVERQLLDKYDIDIQDSAFVEAVYNGRLNRFNKSVYGRLKEIDPPAYERERIQFLARLVDERSDHLKASLNHLRGSNRRQVVIFLDNIDQRDDEFQERVFLLSESLASEWPATVFVSLRPATFYRSRSKGALTAYQTRVFTIAPPRVETVLKKRIQFALDQLRDASRLETFAPGVNIESESLADYFEVLLQNIDSNLDLNRLIANLANGNMRKALEFVSSFIGSGHVNTRTILDAYRTSGRYVIPLHQFLRAIIYADHEYYDPSSSQVANLFDISQPDGREHFLAALIIGQVEAAGAKGGDEVRDGFVSADSVYSYMQGLGFNPDQIAWAIERLVQHGLLERSPQISRPNARLMVRPTSIGIYTARILTGLFTYLDAMVVDTPIVDSQYRSLISDARVLTERLRRSEVFRVYLDREWRRLEPILTEPPFNWRDQSAKVAAEVARITERAEQRQY